MRIMGRVLTSRKAALTLLLVAIITTLGTIRPTHSATDDLAMAIDVAVDSDWPTYGGPPASTRFSSLAQITKENVSDLSVAWIYRTGVLPRPQDAGLQFTFETTPIKVGESLYLCTPRNQVVALDAETGQPRWTFDPHVHADAAYNKACRGVAYFAVKDATDECAERILTGTTDARLMAVDARTGHPCSDFGNAGTVDLLQGLGEVKPGFAYSTSPPTIIGRNAVIGSWIMDGIETGEPSGVVRAFDAQSGKLVWAWDAGRLQDHAGAEVGQTFTRGTPNVWSIISADPKLGLVYLPTGVSTPDYYGGYRTPDMERYASSIVALDGATGAVRWSFQTVHHDLWDYDVPSAPVLADLKSDTGLVPALIQATKTGNIFVLDRRTGVPIAEVQERAVPKSTTPGERASATQPFSVGVANVSPPALREADMWGITPFDSLWCRIKFRKARYEGPFTPPSLQGSILYPGVYGATDWGGVSFDESRQLLIANSSRMAFLFTLLPRDSAAAKGGIGGNAHVGVLPQLGTPYAVMGEPFLSPLGVPCNAPPWGLLTAINMQTRQVAWEKPFGTARDTGPLGLHFGLPFNIGVFSQGGSLVTKPGLTFIAATIDRYLRAFDSDTGAELWKARLPAGGQASPMTYTSKSGRQFIVIAAGGHSALMTKPGDYVIAYALPSEGAQAPSAQGAKP